MSLLTRCPRCQTLFRVTPAQLQARAGTLRCGRCMHVFDGYQALGAEPQHALAAPVQPAAAPADERGASQTPASIATPTAAEKPPPVMSASSSGAPSASAVGPTGVSTEPQSLRVHAPAITAENASVADRPDYPQQLLRTPMAAQLWSIAAVALAVLLVLQAAFTFRSELAARYPIARSAFTAICEHAGCSLTLPQRPDLVRIEASDVHMIDANRPQLVQLTATLRSYASFDVAYPALDLVLTNSNEHALARRIFTPDEYLDQTRDPQSGIAANAEITVALDLDTGNLNAAGFRLDLLPAP